MGENINRLIWFTLLLFVTALIADQVSTRILIYRDGISGETNDVIRMFWDKYGGLWIIGDIMITGLAYIMAYLLTGIEEKGVAIAFSKYAFTSLIIVSATIKIMVSCNNMKYLFTRY